jgi:hypothetical protein
LGFANPTDLKGRQFNCETCPKRIQKIRRCREEREDFTSDDGAIWPMQITKHGGYYSFCPAKATWSHEVHDYFNMLLISCETGNLPYFGGIMDQEPDFIENLSWFLPRWDMLKFNQKVHLVLGDGKKSK